MFGNRLIKSNNAGAACTTDTVQILGGTSCIAYYKMSDATDETGSYDGTPTDVNFNVAGKFGNAGEFNGTSSKINTGYIQTGQVYSASFWGKGFSAGASVLRDTPAAGGANTFMDIATGANGQVIIGGNVALAPSYTPSTDWTHYAVVLDGTNATIYENGSQIATKTYTAKTGNNGTPVHMMSNGAYPVGFSGGYLDQIRIFNRAITPEEVTTLYDEVQCIPTIVPSEHFNTALYTGNSGTQSITSLDFQPDLVWIKRRNTTEDHALFDSVRGALKMISSNLTAAEYTTAAPYEAVSSFDSNGFTTGDNGATNRSPNTYVAWAWKAGGPDVLNQDGTIDSQVSANTEAGFSIVKYNGNGTSGATVGHGLSSAPEMVIIKRTNDVSNWRVGTNATGTLLDGYFNLTNALSVDTSTFQSFNSNTITLGSSNDVNTPNVNDAYIAYCFHSVDGFSKFGSYVGTGTTSGATIVTGFEPAFVMIKRTDAAGFWTILDNKRDTTNPNDKPLYANASNAESTAQATNFYENGFQPVTTDSDVNASGSYIYMAFAEEVFVPDNFFNDDSTVATYKLDGNAGDDSGNGYNGIASNVTYAAGKFDEAGVFNGSSSKIATNITNSVIPVNSDFTISIWINTSATSGLIVGEGNWNSWSTAGFAIGMMSSNVVELSIANNGGAGGTQIVSSSIPLNTWTNVTATIDIGNFLKLYINGSEVASTVLSGNSRNSVSGGFYIGSDSSGFYFNGSIDQVRIFNRALDAGEVLQLYNE